MLKRLVKPLVFASLITGTLSVQAHRLWILPDVTVLSGEEPTATFDAAVSNSIFNFDHVALRPEAIHITAPDGSDVDAENAAKTRYRTVFDLSMKQEGTYRVYLSMAGMNAFWKDADGKRHMFPGRGKSATPEEIQDAIPDDAEDLQRGRELPEREGHGDRGERLLHGVHVGVLVERRQADQLITLSWLQQQLGAALDQPKLYLP